MLWYTRNHKLLTNLIYCGYLPILTKPLQTLTCSGGAKLPILSPILGIINLKFCQSYKFLKIASYYCFGLHFFDYHWNWTSFHVFIVPFKFFFYGLSIHVLCSFSFEGCLVLILQVETLCCSHVFLGYRLSLTTTHGGNQIAVLIYVITPFFFSLTLHNVLSFYYYIMLSVSLQPTFF